MIKKITPLLLLSLFAILLVGILTGCKKKGPCDTLVCQNGGYCSGDTCVCKPGYSGAVCENFNACDTISCLNGGSCASGLCNCPYYAGGRKCDTLVRQQFIDSFSGTISSSLITQGESATVVITTGPDSLSEITMTLYASLVSGDSVHATVYRNGSIYTPLQTVGTGTASGTGVLSGVTLKDTLNLSNGIASGVFYFAGTKQ